MKLLVQLFLFFSFIFSVLAEPISPKFNKNQLSNFSYSDTTPAPKGKYKNKKKHGIWLYYFPKGNIQRKEKWKNGKLLWQIIYASDKRKLYGVNAAGDTSFYNGCNCAN